MMKPNNVLLASHGSLGANAAVSQALDLCQEGAALHHVVVVPSFWKGMMGDDWLNNGISRDRYARHIESELGREIDAHLQDVREKAEAAQISYSHEIQIGEPHNIVLAVCEQRDFDMVVVGSTRPKGVDGVNSKMDLGALSRMLNVPLLVVPFPNQSKP